jgi:hypothetical protein
MTTPRFTAEDAKRARDTWGCNCGPAAIAAVCGLTLDAVRPHLGDFEQKRYTNPALMQDTLRRVGARWHAQAPPLAWPDYGLARVQWEGPWTAPGAPVRARRRHTHWVGAQRTPGSYGVFDVNCMNSGGWVGFTDWAKVIVPWLLKRCEPEADGKWHLTHVLEVARP